MIGEDGKNKSKLSIQKCLELLYCWALKYEQCIVEETININLKTISLWYSYFRVLCIKIFMERSKLGKEKNVVIEIDECL